MRQMFYINQAVNQFGSEAGKEHLIPIEEINYIRIDQILLELQEEVSEENKEPENTEITEETSDKQDQEVEQTAEASAETDEINGFPAFMISVFCKTQRLDFFTAEEGGVAWLEHTALLNGLDRTQAQTHEGTPSVIYLNLDTVSSVEVQEIEPSETENQVQKLIRIGLTYPSNELMGGKPTTQKLHFGFIVPEHLLDEHNYTLYTEWVEKLKQASRQAKEHFSQINQ